MGNLDILVLLLYGIKLYHYRHIRTIDHCNGQKLMQKVDVVARTSVINVFTPSNVSLAYIICLTRAMFTNIDTRTLEKIYHCHKL